MSLIMWNQFIISVAFFIFLIIASFKCVLTFNLNVGLARIFTGNRSDVNSLFGYTVDFLLTRETPPKKWILVGAPKAFDKFQPSLREPGALFRCDPDGGGNCDQVEFVTGGNTKQDDSQGTTIVNFKDNGWFGASLAVGDAIMVCAPRWRDNIETILNQNSLTHMSGICYEIGRIMDKRTSGIFALFGQNVQQNWTHAYPPEFNTVGTYYNLLHGQMGMSVRPMDGESSTLIIGAPGVSDGNGGAITFNQNSVIGREPVTADRNNDYFGYAVMPGKFLGDMKTYVAIGGPRGKGTGEVKILGEFRFGSYDVKSIIKGEETGSYFGSVLCAVDVDKNERDVLVVGAPFFGNLTVVNFDTNHINQDEGKVYVYAHDGQMGMTKIQTLRGSMSRNARFGSALATPGDLNKDGANDLIIGAPYEEDGKGAIYIFNGYKGKFWHRPTQIIKASSIDPNLKGFGFYLSQFKLDVDNNLYNDLAIGAPWSNRVVMLRSNPTISMVVSLETDLTDNIIKNDTKSFTIRVCFKYEGDQSSPPDVTVNYTVGIDYNRTMLDKRERVVAADGSNSVTGEKKVIKGYVNPQCSNGDSMIVQSHRQDIVSPVTFIVKYGIMHQSGTGKDCSIDPCPIISMFDAQRQVPDADFFQDMIEFKKPGCGVDNQCNTDLQITVYPTFNHGVGELIRGPGAGFTLDVKVKNMGEAAYGVDFRVYGPKFISYWKVVGKASDVTCSPRNTVEGDESYLECGLSNSEVPLFSGSEVMFRIFFVAPEAPPLESFDVVMKLVTLSNDINMANNVMNLSVPVKSKADIDFSGVGNPELFVTSKTKTDSVYHLFDFNNKGPSELDFPTTLTVDYPSVVIDSKEILIVSNLTITVPADVVEFDCGQDYNTEIVVLQVSSTDVSGKDSKKTYLITEKNPSTEDLLQYNCKHATCKKLSCSISPLNVNSIMTVRITYRMDPNILAKVKKQDSGVESLSILSIATVFMSDKLGLITDPEYTATAKTDVVPAEQKEEKVAWWVVFLGVLGALIVLAIIIFVFYKLGFFKRKALDELTQLKKKSKYEEKPKTDQQQLIENGKEKEPIPEKEDGTPKPDINVPVESTIKLNNWI